MSEDDRFLPFFLREPVYVVPEPKKSAAEPVAKPLPVAGLGEQSILVLIYEPEHAFLSPADQAFFKKILQALSLSADDIALVNWYRTEAKLQVGIALDQHLPDQSYKTTLVFGEVPQPWSQSNFFEAYTVKSQETKRFLQAASLAKLAQDAALKVRFWKCLQDLFL